MDTATNDFRSRVEAARAEAIRTGRTVKLAPPAPAAEPTPAEEWPLHQTPCVCGPYDRCRGVRVQDARDVAHRGANAMFRAMHRAYND